MAVRTKIVPLKNLQHLISNLHTFFFLQYDYNNWMDLLRTYSEMHIYKRTIDPDRYLWGKKHWLSMYTL